MQDIFFTIIIPTYNRASLLKRAVESVIIQTFKNWELIVVDDGSTDNTKDVIAAINNNKIRYIYQENKERSAARNKGIDLSKGHYICFLDSDDYFLENRLDLLHKEIVNRNFPQAFIFTGLKYINGPVLSYSDLEIKSHKNILDYLTYTIIGVPQVCIHKNILRTYRFNEMFRIAEDTELWLRIAQNSEVLYFEDQITVIATEHEERSVNERRYNSGQDQLRTLKHIFSSSHSGKLISPAIKNLRLSNTYFSIARYYLYQKKKSKALINIILSLIYNIKNKQTKHKLNILLNLCYGRILKEYRK
ncbi:MAG: glycosyltransferase family 2 protein [Bacteroidales bacterium]|nr:glycosyltransferase family 2 protein [Bacteroidales bacterium]